MRRRLSASFLAIVASLLLAAPVMADTAPGPGPGNFPDSGTSDYFYAYAGVCGPASCTDYNVSGQVVDLQGGDTFASVCVDIFTYGLHGGRGDFSGGCVEAAPQIADDLSTALFSGSIPIESCNRRDLTLRRSTCPCR